MSNSNDVLIVSQHTLPNGLEVKISVGRVIDLPNKINKQHPCATCPNFTNDTCCHSTAKPLHKVAMKVWGQV